MIWFSLVVLCYILHSAIHEIGHLIFGFICKMRFNSFRLGVVQITPSGISLVNASITSGQCIMTPIQEEYTSYNWLLYDLGGIIANVFLLIILHLFNISLSANLLAFVILLTGSKSDLTHIFLSLKDKSYPQGTFNSMKIYDMCSKGSKFSEIPKTYLTPTTSLLGQYYRIVCTELIKGDFEKGVDSLGKLLYSHRFIDDDIGAVLRAEKCYIETKILGLERKPLHKKYVKKVKSLASVYPSCCRYLTEVLGLKEYKDASPITLPCMKEYESIMSKGVR